MIGDLNSRRGRPLGMEPKGAATEIKAEVPMAEVLDYAPDLRAITGGRGDYTMEFAALRGGSRRTSPRRWSPTRRATASSAAAQINLGAVEFETCAVCGRTILRGERCYAYVDPEAGEASVCPLCKPRAESQGWLPAEFAAAVAAAAAAATPRGDGTARALRSHDPPGARACA